ncbi:MAG: 4Fe-4S binding protein [Oscillospiraceae bacterium]|nr:4Fe-4S binding protein [Oscillospiraceae bacterium]
MNKIFYFSGSGKSKRLAENLGQTLEMKVYDITKTDLSSSEKSETAVIVFPVYCQNIPDPLIKKIPEIKAENIAFIATYGKKSFGNVIEDAVSLSSSNFIAGACVPCGHSFLDEADNFDFESLSPVIERIKNPKKAKVKKGHKDFYADLIPAKRTRIGVKLTRTNACVNCGMCEENCPMGAISGHEINDMCIRCLRCVKNCPHNAIEFKTLWFLKIYLASNRKNNIEIYL